MNAVELEVLHLRRAIAQHEQTIADMLHTQRPILRDALRYQALRESQRDAVVVILTNAGGHMAEPHQIDIAVDQLIESNKLKEAA